MSDVFMVLQGEDFGEADNAESSNKDLKEVSMVMMVADCAINMAETKVTTCVRIEWNWI
jgi:hypothetical protein